MNNSRIKLIIGAAGVVLMISACKAPDYAQKSVDDVPVSYDGSQDTTNTAMIQWKDYFLDPDLNALIDSALVNNQELNIVSMEIEMTQNEVMARKGEYLPSLGLNAGGGVDKSARYTVRGATEATTEIEPGKEMPDPVPDMMLAAQASWEVDIWRKLRNSRDAAAQRYLASIEGKNFMVTNLVAEIANTYYELLALDNQLEIVQNYIEIQSNALEIVKLEKQAARVTELAVKKFEAELYHTKSLQFDIKQSIVETENRLNFLVGRYPQPVQRSSQNFINLVPDTIYAGVPSQLLQNRPDIKQAEYELEAAKLDIKVAKANFYPSLRITGAMGIQAFNPAYIVRPESMLYSLAGELAAPLINRKAIKAEYYNANAKQIQAVFDYNQTVLNAFIEVSNQMSNINNLKQSYDLRSKEVQALTESIQISGVLFKSARADYMEILMTQRDALGSKFDLVETKLQQMNAMVNIYRALGGGWQ